MNCPYCKNPIPDGAAYCNTCGSRMPGQASNPPRFNEAGVYRSNSSYGDDAPDYLVWSIITLILCQPFGIAALVFSVLTITDKNNDRMESARKNSEWAGKLVGIGMTLGIIYLVGVGLFVVFASLH